MTFYLRRLGQAEHRPANHPSRIGDRLEPAGMSIAVKSKAQVRRRRAVAFR